MLTAVQASHVIRAFPECQVEMAAYLSRGVEVFIAQQDECGPDVPPFAICVAERPEFWIDCAVSIAEARSLAVSLGLRVGRAHK